jgi:hypothetical protein
MHHIGMDFVMLTLAIVLGVVLAPVLVPWTIARGREDKGTAGVILFGVPGIAGWMILLDVLGYPVWLVLVPMVPAFVGGLVWSWLSK